MHCVILTVQNCGCYLEQITKFDVLAENFTARSATVSESA
jgi:hypothetical protein